MDGISGSNSLLKTYNRSLPSKQSSTRNPQVIYKNDDVGVKQGKSAEDCLQSPPTLQNAKLPENHVKLDRWIIKPLGDGICVEGHRRLPNFLMFTVLLYAD